MKGECTAPVSISYHAISNNASRAFEYYFQESNSGGAHRQLLRTRHRLDDFPPELNKKVTIIKHFQSYLYKSSPGPTSDPVGAPMEIVTKYAKIKDHLLFRLSNRIIQASFADGTNLVVAQEGHVITYIDEESNQHTVLTQTLVSETENNHPILEKVILLRHMLDSILPSPPGQER